MLKQINSFKELTVIVASNSVYKATKKVQTGFYCARIRALYGATSLLNKRCLLVLSLLVKKRPSLYDADNHGSEFTRCRVCRVTSLQGAGFASCRSVRYQHFSKPFISQHHSMAKQMTVFSVDLKVHLSQLRGWGKTTQH